ncbi:hypothetical protein SAMN05444372_101150 [Flavobacterium micromati]|uniref:Uncharacterized protein n=1 Tax=Flavobacterium micromati TaxID=229205 RepID=A0A1M5FIP5_9FLAO|nr:hypothetical protein [Flavobacterium micromati]SHF91366.1 hypothetical protein SAMN05444372_101150 [Flavobacterium micromati]
MINNEYLNVKEISVHTSQSTRNVRRIISRIQGEVAAELMYKDKNNTWRVHKLLLGRFKPQRIREHKYYALSIDLCHDYSEDEIEVVLRFAIEQMDDVPVEMNYVIEQKKANGQNHIHCYVRCNNKKKLLRCIRLGFSAVSYHQSGIFDLVGWKQYITKDNNKIIKIDNFKKNKK